MTRAIEVLLALALVASHLAGLRRLTATLGAGLALDIAQAIAAAYLVGERAPGVHYAGTARAIFHASQAAFLAWPALAVAHVSLALGRSSRSATTWAALVACAVAAYPHHHADLPSPVYVIVQAGAALACGVAVASWALRGRWPLATHRAALVLGAGEVGTLVPYLAGNAARDWHLAAVARGGTWLALIVICLTEWRRASTSAGGNTRPSGSRSRS